MKLDEVLQLQVLKLKALTSGHANTRLIDHMIDAGESPELRQMCAKVSTHLYDSLEQVCGLLDMTKRQFIEAAVADAVGRAEELIEKLGALEGAQRDL